MKVIPVTCALIFHLGKVLAVQRSSSMPLPGKWEFPGGKVEEGENPEKGLIREIQEEISIQIRIFKPLKTSDYSYSPGKTIRLIPFLATWESGKIRLLEHEQLKWLERDQLFSVDWAAADVPIVQELQEKWVKLAEEINATP